MLRIKLGGVYGSPTPTKRKYRQYSPTTLTKAYSSVVDGDLSVRRASKVYDVPMQTLRDRVLGHVDPDTTRSGAGPLFSELEEARLVNHIKEMATVGYPYTRAEVINTATEYATCLGKKDGNKSLTFKWFYAFLGRWPELKVQRPKSISELRAKATSRQSIMAYFNELDKILEKHNLKNSPESIYNVDEKGVQQNFKPHYVVGSSESTTSVVTSERSSTTTILGCGNALGQQIPPYFVFAGARMRAELLDGASPGTQGTVSKSGWSNGEVFQRYLETHFVKYATAKRPLLLLYDGHRSHISPHIIDWAVVNNIILYVLPPHTSHILQPMDVGCFGAFSKMYSAECSKHQRNTGQVVDRYSVCTIACKAYSSALSVRNLQSAFKKSGVFPFSPDSIDSSLFETNELRASLEVDCQTDTFATVTESTDHTPSNYEPLMPEEPLSGDQPFTAVPILPRPETDKNTNVQCQSNDPIIKTFFQKKRPSFKPPIKSDRKSISKIIAGKAITEPEVAFQVKEYLHSVPVANKSKATNKPKKWHAPVKMDSPKPSTSGLSKSGGPVYIDDDDDDDDDYDIDDDDDDKCCVCGKFQPAEVAKCQSIVFVKWAKCDFCDHWTHLIFCTKVRVIRRGDIFKCPHCEMK